MSFGVLEFQVVSAEGIGLSDKELYYLEAVFPIECARPNTIYRTGKNPGNKLEWTLSQDVVLVNRLLPTAAITLRCFEKSVLRADRLLCKCDVSLAPLAHATNIDSVPFTLQTPDHKDCVRVTVQVAWKGALPEGLLEPAVLDAQGNVVPPVALASGVTGGGTQNAYRPTMQLPPSEGNDYGVRVRLHRGRNLQSFKEDKLYNPQVVVSICGKTLKTDVAKKSNDPIWDEEVVFAFNKVKDTFWSECITITVVNARVGLPNETIGSVQLDCATVYRDSPQHFMQNKWMVLHRSATEGNVMGFIKVSVAVLNLRTDAFPDVEDEPTDESEEMINLMAGPGSVFEEILLHCDIIRAEGLAQLNSLGITPNPFVRVSFGKCVMNAPHVSNTFNPTWKTSVNLPLLLPSLANTLTVQLWNYDKILRNDLIATVRMDLGKLLNLGVDGLPSLPPQWVSFYGHPRGCDADFNRYYKTMARGEKKGTDFRGRLLIGMEGCRGKPPPPRTEVRECTVTVCGIAQLLMFNMLPSGGKYKVRVSMGTFSATTGTHEAQRMVGTEQAAFCVYFGEDIQFTARFAVVPPDSTHPNDAHIADQLPDVVFQLIQDNPLAAALGSKEVEAYASTRFSAGKMLGNTSIFYKCKPMRLNSDPEKVGEGSSPENPLGQLLCGLYISDVIPPNPLLPTATSPSAWTSYITAAPMDKFILECCVYMARQLPAGDSNGLSDPYVRVVWANSAAHTGRKLETLNPIFNELIRVVADTKQRFPDIVVEVWDWDRFGSNTFLCKTVVPFEAQEMSVGQTKWISHFTDSVGKLVEGCELLINFKVLKGTSHSLVNPPMVRFSRKVGVSEFYDGYAIPAERILPSSLYVLRMSLFGLRHMRKFRLREIQKPSVEIEVAGHVAKADALPGPNPDYNKEFEMVLELPDNESFLPQINLRVHDHRVGPKSLVGSAVIAMNSPLFDPTLKKKRKEDADKAIDDRLDKILEIKARTEAAKPKESFILKKKRPNVKLSLLAKAKQTLGIKVKEEKSVDFTEPLIPKEDSINYDPPVVEESNEGAEERTSPAKGVPTDAFTINSIIRESLQAGDECAIQEEKTLHYDTDADSQSGSSDGEEELWFDRFDPEGLGVEVPAERVVSRLGKMKLLPAGESTVEDYFGPFNDDFEEVELTRGWGSDVVKAGVALFDMEIVKTAQPMKPSETPIVRRIDSRLPVYFLARVYILCCTNLAAKDSGLLGKASDPYVVLTLGSGASLKDSIRISCKEQGKFQTLDPEFYFMKELSGQLPKHNTLRVTIMDHDKITADEEIGSTDINLENSTLR